MVAALGEGHALTAAEQALLSLEQHASLCVELALQPDRTVAILLRYQVTQDHKARADA